MRVCGFHTYIQPNIHPRLYHGFVLVPCGQDGLYLCQRLLLDKGIVVLPDRPCSEIGKTRLKTRHVDAPCHTDVTVFIKTPKTKYQSKKSNNHKNTLVLYIQRCR